VLKRLALATKQDCQDQSDQYHQRVSDTEEAAQGYVVTKAPHEAARPRVS
jgi:hypothetical protein